MTTIIDLTQWRAANEEALEAREPVATQSITSHLFTVKGETMLAALPRIRQALADTPGARLYQTAKGLIVTAATPRRGWFELKLARDVQVAA